MEKRHPYSLIGIDGNGLAVIGYVANAMKRWYMSLPKYAKDCKKNAEGTKIQKRYLEMIGLLRQNISSYELLFVKIPETLGFQEFNAGAADTVVAAKNCYDSLLGQLKELLIKQTKTLFVLKGMEAKSNRMSLPSVAAEWFARGCDSQPV